MTGATDLILKCGIVGVMARSGAVGTRWTVIVGLGGFSGY